MVQTQHQANSPICARGNEGGFPGWIKKRRCFTDCLDKDLLAQPQFLPHMLEHLPQHSVVLVHARHLPIRPARLAPCGAGLDPGIQGFAGASVESGSHPPCLISRKPITPQANWLPPGHDNSPGASSRPPATGGRGVHKLAAWTSCPPRRVGIPSRIRQIASSFRWVPASSPSAGEPASASVPQALNDPASPAAVIGAGAWFSRQFFGFSTFSGDGHRLEGRGLCPWTAVVTTELTRVVLEAGPAGCQTPPWWARSALSPGTAFLLPLLKPRCARIDPPVANC